MKVAVYIDQLTRYPTSAMKDAQTRRNGPWWSHMWADTLEELHTFAGGIGMRRDWLHDRVDFPHYDVTPPKRAQAIRAGALEGNIRDVARAIILAKKQQQERGT